MISVSQVAEKLLSTLFGIGIESNDKWKLDPGESRGSSGTVSNRAWDYS